jgi:hypothetical protein
MEDPSLLNDIAEGLESDNVRLKGDCAEVMTMVGEVRPEWIVPYAESLFPLLDHEKARVRWEAVHALALAAPHGAEIITPRLDSLAALIRDDKSTIVRDYAVQAVGNFARAGREPAEHAYPILKEALSLWDGKQAKHALRGLVNVAALLPEEREEIQVLAQPFLEHKRQAVVGAAKSVLEVTE